MNKSVLKVLASSVFMSLLFAPRVFADDSCGTTVLPCSIEDNLSLLRAILEILVTGGCTIGIIISGIQYMTSKDNPGQMAKAKSRIINIVIGMVIFFAIDAIVGFLGVGGGSSNP